MFGRRRLVLWTQPKCRRFSVYSPSDRRTTTYNGSVGGKELRATWIGRKTRPVRNRNLAGLGLGWVAELQRRCAGSASPFEIAARKCLHIGRGKWLASNSPVPAFDLFDHDPSYGTQGLAFDRYHRVRELADHLLLLRWRENTFDQFDIHKRHLCSPVKCRTFGVVTTERP